MSPDRDEVHQILHGLLDATTVLESMLAESRNNTIAIATVQQHLRSVEERVASLNRTVRGDNGHLSMIASMAVMESNIADLKNWRQEQGEKENDCLKEEMTRRWQIGIAIFGGLMGFMTMVISAAIHWLRP